MSTDWPAYEQIKLQGHALTLSWEINDSNTLKSITAYRELRNDDSVDLDGTPLLIATANRISDYDQTSQELQLIGNAARLDYVLGLYYFTDDGYTINPHEFFLARTARSTASAPMRRPPTCSSTTMSRMP